MQSVYSEQLFASGRISGSRGECVLTNDVMWCSVARAFRIAFGWLYSDRIVTQSQTTTHAAGQPDSQTRNMSCVDLVVLQFCLILSLW